MKNKDSPVLIDVTILMTGLDRLDRFVNNQHARVISSPNKVLFSLESIYFLVDWFHRVNLQSSHILYKMS